jgi:hypothetical protein
MAASPLDVGIWYQDAESLESPAVEFAGERSEKRSLPSKTAFAFTKSNASTLWRTAFCALPFPGNFRIGTQTHGDSRGTFSACRASAGGSALVTAVE